jgi:hypothetical protein
MERVLLLLTNQLKELGSRFRYLLDTPTLELYGKRQIPNAENYQKELIQLAAVAVAALTDFRMAQNPNLSQKEAEKYILAQILLERCEQDKKFNRTFPAQLDPLIWVAVLHEELAEVAEEIVFDTDPQPNKSNN